AGGAIALALWRGAGLRPAAALALAGGAVLLVRMMITANNFMLSARLRAPSPPQFQLTRTARLRLFAEEFRATMLYSSWFMPRAKAVSEVYADSAAPPVLLLHGYVCNSGYWSHLLPHLRARRISHAAPDLEPLMGAIDDYVPMVAHALEQLCARSGAGQAVIVGHSMGGLVARAYLRAHGSARVARVITLGTPHHGTGLAQFGPGENAVQMRRAADGPQPESAWLRALAASENGATRALITSLYSHHDNIVAPASSCALPGAANVELCGIGHVAMARHPLVLARVLDELAALPAAAAQQARPTACSPKSMIE
ncbi:MAG: alpha/beta fold hydrolase, partial [Massilia sp.]